MFKFPGEHSVLQKIRGSIGSEAEALGFTPDEVDDITCAVDEICANIIEHAYAGRVPPPDIHINLHITPDELHIDILDEGEPYDPTRRKLPRFPNHWEEGRYSGLGVYLVHQCVDEFTYRPRADGQNCLRLTKKRT